MGSFRDGAKILEEVSSGSKKVTIRTVEKKYNFGNVNKSTQDLILALERKDSKKSIKIISNLSDENTDFKYFIEQLINELHKKLIEELEGGLEEAKNTKELILVLIESYSSLKYAVLPQLPLELAVVGWCSGEIDKKNDENIDQLKPDIKTIPEVKSSQTKTVSKKTSKNDNILESLIESVGKENFSIAGVLRGCSVEKYDSKSLILSTEYKFHKERLSEKKVIQMLEENLKEITGKDVVVEVVLRPA